MKSRSNLQPLIMGIAILIMAYFPLMSAQNIQLFIQRYENAPRDNYIGLNISYSCTFSYQQTTPSINEVEVDLSFSGPGIQNNSNNVRLSEVRRNENSFRRILEFNPISAQDEGSYHCNGTIVSNSNMQLIGMRERTENIMVLKPTIDISLDPVYPVADYYLNIAPYNNFSFNCFAMVTVKGTPVNLQRVFSWQRTIGGSSSSISTEFFTGSQSSTSGSSVLSINATEAGIHTYTCTVTLDVSPAPDVITRNSSQIQTIIEPMIDISLDPVYPVADRYLDIAPYNSFSFNCSAMVTVKGTPVNLQRVFSWQSTIGGSSSSISTEFFTGSQSSTSGSSVLSINATEVGIHTYTCMVTLNVSPAPDVITRNSSQTQTIIGPSSPAMLMNVDTPSEYLFDNRSRVQWLVSSITYDPESYVVQYRPFESTCSCSIMYMNSAQITSGPNITRVNFLLSVNLSDLVPGTTYEYRVIANNSAGTTISGTRHFTTTTTSTPEQSNVGLAVGLSIFFIIIIIIIIGVFIGIFRSRYKGNLEMKDLHNAAKEGNLEEVKRLIAKGVDPLSKDSYNDTAIHIAAINGWLEVIKFLTEDLQHNPSLPGWHGTTPLHHAAQYGHLTIVQYLMDNHEANPLDKDEDGCLPLHRACIGGSLETIKHLMQSMKSMEINMQAILTFPDKFIHNAAFYGHTNIIKFLIEEYQCDPNLPCSLNGRGPLFIAAQEGHLSTVKYLIVECGCDPASTDTNQTTPLHLAALNGHLETVNYLTDRKCKPTTRNNKNDTPMHYAAIRGQSDVVEYFITVMRCSPHLPGQYGRSPLHYASNKGHLHLVKNLIDTHGCYPNIRDDYDATPLHLAAEFGHLSVVQHLTQSNCNITCQDKNIGTPLHSAASGGHLAIVKHLVEQAHCPTNIKNKYNQIPLQVALVKGHSEVVDYLRTL